jgi:hypothetical protein
MCRRSSSTSSGALEADAFTEDLIETWIDLKQTPSGVFAASGVVLRWRVRAKDPSEPPGPAPVRLMFLRVHADHSPHRVEPWTLARQGSGYVPWRVSVDN